MRRAGALAAGLGICALIAGCDSTQPTLDTTTKDASVEFSMSGGVVDFYDMWDLFIDFDGDGNPDFDLNGDGMIDANDIVPFCNDADRNGEPDVVDTQAATSVPWELTAQIEILRGGETVPEVVTSSAAAFDENQNLTAYDTKRILGFTPARPPNRPAFEVYSNPRRQSAASFEVLTGRFCLDNPSPGAARLGPDPLPLQVGLSKGDTIVVRARRGTDPAAGLMVQSSPRLASRLLIDGAQAQVNGDSSTSDQPGAALFYTFTVR